MCQCGYKIHVNIDYVLRQYSLFEEEDWINLELNSLYTIYHRNLEE